MGFKKAMKLIQRAEECLTREAAQKILRKWEKNESKQEKKQ